MVEEADSWLFEIDAVGGSACEELVASKEDFRFVVVDFRGRTLGVLIAGASSMLISVVDEEVFNNLPDCSTRGDFFRRGFGDGPVSLVGDKGFDCDDICDFGGVCDGRVRRLEAEGRGGVEVADDWDGGGVSKPIIARSAAKSFGRE